jgi:predicted Zn-dependent protease
MRRLGRPVAVSVLLASLVLTTCFVSTCTRAPETGRRQFIIVDDDTMNKLGSDAYSEMKKEEKISKDPEINQIVKRVGDRITKASDRTDYEWEFTVFDEPKTINAFALPGGKVGVYTGILPVAENEAGLAVVIGHEIAHVIARHGGERVSQQMGTSLVLEAASIGLQNNPNRNLIMAGLGVGATVGVLLPYSRTHESEADKIGIRYMARAGYDPSEAPKFWGRMNAQAGGTPPEFLSTHPSPETRTEELEKLVTEVMPEYQSSPKYGQGEKLPAPR